MRPMRSSSKWKRSSRELEANKLIPKLVEKSQSSTLKIINQIIHSESCHKTLIRQSICSQAVQICRRINLQYKCQTKNKEQWPLWIATRSKHQQICCRKLIDNVQTSKTFTSRVKIAVITNQILRIPMIKCRKRALVRLRVDGSARLVERGASTEFLAEFLFQEHHHKPTKSILPDHPLFKINFSYQVVSMAWRNRKSSLRIIRCWAWRINKSYQYRTLVTKWINIYLNISMLRSKTSKLPD